jgi:hypothetical protein
MRDCGSGIIELSGREPSEDELRSETRFAAERFSAVLCEVCGRKVWLVDRPTIEIRLEMYGLEAFEDGLTVEAPLGGFSVAFFAVCGRKLCLAGGALVEIG